MRSSMRNWKIVLEMRHHRQSYLTVLLIPLNSLLYIKSIDIKGAQRDVEYHSTVSFLRINYLIISTWRYLILPFYYHVRYYMGNQINEAASIYLPYITSEVIIYLHCVYVFRSPWFFWPSPLLSLPILTASPVTEVVTRPTTP